MKNNIVSAVLCFAITFCVSAAMAAPGDGGPGNGIVGTAHDLSTSGRPAWGDAAEQADLDRICVYCHAPHHAAKPADYMGSIDYLPLWNHALSVTDMWTTYSNGLDEPTDEDHASYAEANSGDPGGISKLCLSCHDGSVATNSYGFVPGDVHTGTITIPDTYSASIGYGGNLSNHHPIGFIYADAQASDDEIAPGTTIMVGSETINDLLWAGKMECSTCHDVHNTKNTGEKFQWISDRNSEFCLTCHLKNQ